MVLKVPRELKVLKVRLVQVEVVVLKEPRVLKVLKVLKVIMVQVEVVERVVHQVRVEHLV